MGTLYVPIQTRSKKSKSFFASCQKNPSFLAFWEHCQRHHPELFFSRILILHEKKEEKKLCEIRYDEEKKSNTQLCDKYVFVSLIRFFESLFPMALCVIL